MSLPPSDERNGRRRIVLAAGVALGWAAAGCRTALADAASAARPAEGEEEEIPATEDLMREHGVLRRVLLAYDEVSARLDGGGAVDAAVVAHAAEIVRRFVEGYHERSEEEHVFPRLERAGKLLELVRVLRDQHAAGRRLTAQIAARATARGVGEAPSRRELADAMRAFARMYRPHAAREDTVLFPATRATLSKKDFEALGETLERDEERILGEHGFERAVGEVAALERALGIDDLARFTPR